MEDLGYLKGMAYRITHTYHPY